MSRRPSHLRKYPAKRLARIHPALAVFTAVIAVLGAAAVVTGTVGGLAARHRTSQPVPAETDPTGASDGWRSDSGPAEPTAGEPTGTDDGAPSTGTGTGTGTAATPARPAAPLKPARSGPAPRPPAPASGCTVTAKLVPTCGRLWGVAPGAYTDLPPTRALAGFEEKTGRPADILHVYHRGDDLFPTRDEQAAADQGGRHRIIFANWKVAWGTTWADVAEGGQDARIDRLADYLKRTYTDTFYLAIHHEPENDVKTDPDSGMTADDYAAMFRHTVERLRDRGVDNAVMVMVYMSYEHWCVQSWFQDLWPGDDVVDWVGFDPYLFSKPANYGFGDFDYLVNRTSDADRWPGFYNWVTRNHGNKPLMLAEWGVFDNTADASKKAWIFSTVADQLNRYPAIRALVYFDSPAAPKGDTRPDSSDEALAEYRRLAESSHFDVEVG